MSPKIYKCLPQSEFQLDVYSLCPVQPTSIENIRIWRNEQMDMLRQREVLSAETQVKYFSEKIWPSMEEDYPEQILFDFYKETSHIGYGGLVHISWPNQRSEISFLVAPERAHNTVLYREDFLAFLQLIRRVAFDNLGLHRLFTETYEFRKHHLAILEEAGFLIEGRLKDHIVVQRAFADSILHGYVNGS